MDWFVEQLQLEQEWAKLYPHTLSPIAQSGIVFLMSKLAPSEAWDKMKTLILANKFLNGLIQGHRVEGNKQWLICNPWGNPSNMPNIDPSGPHYPSPLECPKANLREIFTEFYNMVLCARAADVHAIKGRSPARNRGYAKHIYPGESKLPPLMGCHLWFSQDAGVPCELVVYQRADKNSDVLKPVTSLKHAQMGSKPAPFVNPAVLSSEYEENHPYWGQLGSQEKREPWELLESIGRFSVEDPPSQQMKMLAQMHYCIDKRYPSYPDQVSALRKNDRNWQTRPQYPLLRHPREILVNTNIGPNRYEVPLNAYIGSPGAMRSPNFGFTFQPARTEVPGQAFQRVQAVLSTEAELFNTAMQFKKDDINAGSES
ncbi:hypothetical protein F53441_9324 [Fusarium austroafricanum]|uniref:Uncharacterized protein n=1 Tax=Fusarium austroafricanum TaxID=2364996 RepID=A0A8H4NVM1_9HYPO|nr:hypothetical protein F53441_9324 [Fusarium austroafricanum]